MREEYTFEEMLKLPAREIEQIASRTHFFSDIYSEEEMLMAQSIIVWGED